jgi:hypothetical protein
MTRSTLVLGTLVGVVFFGMTSSAYAYEDLAQIAKTTDATFCASIKELAKVPEDIAATQKRYEQYTNTRLTTLNEIRADRDRVRFEERNEREKNRLEHYAKIQARAGTEMEKNAISVFTKAVDAATVKRKTVYDGATTLFRKGINDAVASRNKDVDVAISAFKKKVESAIARAERDCRSAVGSKQARSTYLSLLSDARTAFQDSIYSMKSLSVSVEALSVTKNASLIKAESDFVKAIDRAIAELRKTIPGA